MKALTALQNILSVTVLVLISAGMTHAKTIMVDNDGTADFRTIRAAVASAADGDVIILQPGRYAGAEASDIIVSGTTLTIRSTDPNDPETVANTVIDCQSDDEKTHRFLELAPNSGTDLTLVGLTMINGSGGFGGGAVLCEAASLRAINCTFAHNAVEWYGGAIHSVNGYVNLEGCTFTNNTSVRMHGGAIYGRNSILNVADCTFRSNAGNAVKSFDSAVTLFKSTFESNTGREGGAVFSHAGLDPIAPSYLNVVRCTFAGNNASLSGGALYLHNMEAMITASQFTSNTATEHGGAIYGHRSSPSITSCVFAHNSAVQLGGAVTGYYESEPEILHCTLVGNEAASGGAVASKRDSHPVVTHCILWANQAAQGTALYVAEDSLGTGSVAQATLEYSNTEGGPAAAYAEPGCSLTWGRGNIDANPLFAGPGFDDFHLSPDSPSVDTGDPNYVPDSDATDLDGYPRRFGKTVDMGAYEYQGLGPVYRFWSPSKNRHFYTIKGTERDKLIANYSHVWQYEGIAYYAFYRNSEANLAPVYRLWSSVTGDHVWTTSEAERDQLLTEFGQEWVDEGIVFYGYAPGKPPLGTSPVHRFYSAALSSHFYTMDEAERDKLVKEYAAVWAYEGVAYYAYAIPYQPKEITYNFIGGDEDAWVTMVLAAYIDGVEADIDVPEIRFTITSAWMQLTTDFLGLTTTLDGFEVQSQVIEHLATITQKGYGGVSIPLELSAEVKFESLFPRGPFVIDPDTGTFADFGDGGETLGAGQETYTYNGSIALGSIMQEFDGATSATALELESSGTFESLGSLPDNVDVNMPLTFQWHGPSTKQLLTEAYVDGHLVQVYVTQAYVSTQGTWEGQAVD